MGTIGWHLKNIAATAFSVCGLELKQKVTEEQVFQKKLIIKTLLAKQCLEKRDFCDLSLSEKTEVREYWAQFGIKIRSFDWYRVFKGLYGFSPQYVSDDIYAYVIWPYLNKEDFVRVYMDKNAYDYSFPSLRFPDTVLRKINGKYYGQNYNYLGTVSDARSVLISEKEIIVKDALESGEGRGIKKYGIVSRDDVDSMLAEWEDAENCLFQRVIKEHSILADFNQSSVNILRVNSLFLNGRVQIMPSCIRFGTPGYITDTCYIDGYEIGNVVGVSSEGVINDSVVTYLAERRPLPFDPKERTLVIPKWKEIIEAVKEAHKSIHYFDLVGWDVVIDPNEDIIFIEYNIKRPGIKFLQYVNGPFFGELTDEVMNPFKDREFQLKHIPSYFRL